MDWLSHLFTKYPEMAVYLAIGIGYLIGKLKFHGVGLGVVTGSLLCGIFLGVPVSDQAKSMLFLLFLFGIGYSVGPSFFRSIKVDSWRRGVLGVFVSGMRLLAAYSVARFLHLDPGYAAGLLSGSLMESPAIGTASEAIRALSTPSTARGTAPAVRSGTRRNRMKIQKPYLFVAIFLLAAIIPANAVAQSQAPTDETQALRKLVEQMQTQMAQMQAEIDQLKGKKTEVPPTQATQAATPPSTAPPRPNGTIQTAEPPRVGPTSPHVGEATASYREFSEDTFAAARFNNVPLDPKYQGFFQLPGTQTILKIGGYFKTDFIYDLKPAGNIDAFIPSSFPIPQITGVNNTTISVRPTRLSLDFRIPYTKVGEVRFYVESDFFGTNSTTPRLRHAYAQARNLLIGQTFTNFMDPDAFPDGLDFQGPNGMVSLRNPQFRYGFALSSHTTFYISAEKPSSDIIFKTAQFTVQPNAPSPDGAIRLREEFERGHFQVAGLFRSIAAFLPDGRTDSVFGWGVNTSLGLKTFGRDNVILEVAAGHGISRYIQDTSGLGIDAEPATGVHTHLVATPAVGVEAAYQHYWSKRLRSSAIYSYAAVNDTDLAAPTTYNHATYTGANLIWNPGGSLNVGAEFLYGWTMEQNGQSANAPRIQFSAKYSFVKVDPDQK
jgi:hypothetical protein